MKILFRVWFNLPESYKASFTCTLLFYPTQHTVKHLQHLMASFSAVLHTFLQAELPVLFPVHIQKGWCWRQILIWTSHTCKPHTESVVIWRTRPTVNQMWRDECDWSYDGGASAIRLIWGTVELLIWANHSHPPASKGAAKTAYVSKEVRNSSIKETEEEEEEDGEGIVYLMCNERYRTNMSKKKNDTVRLYFFLSSAHVVLAKTMWWNNYLKSVFSKPVSSGWSFAKSTDVKPKAPKLNKPVTSNINQLQPKTEDSQRCNNPGWCWNQPDGFCH